MAEIQIKNVAPDRPDLTAEQIAERIVPLGGIVAIRDDGFEWGHGDTFAAHKAKGFAPAQFSWKFLLLKIPGEGPIFLEGLITPRRVPIESASELALVADEQDLKRRTHLREWVFDLTRLAQPQRDELALEGELIIPTWKEARRAMRSVIDGRRF